MPKLISGVKSDEAMKIQTINPTTEQVIGEYEAVTEEQVHTEVRNSREIFEKVWKKIDLSERAKLLRDLSYSKSYHTICFDFKTCPKN